MRDQRPVTRTPLASALLAGVVIAVSASPASAAICNVSSAGVAFGNYDTLASTPLDGVGAINVSCDVSTSIVVALSSGSGSFAQRQMTAGTSQLGYNLYTDATRTIVWGDGISGSTVSATGSAIDLSIYGRVPARQNVTANVYSDIVTITVSY